MDKDPTPRTRVQRPDQSAAEQEIPVKLDKQGHTTADTPPEDADTDGVMATDQGGTERPEDAGDDDAPVTILPEEIPEPSEDGTPHFRPPFSVMGNVVQDEGGRTVAIVGASHMIPATREKAALWIAGKLNA